MADKIFLDENEVTVTEDQLRVHGRSFRIRDIRRVGVIRKRRRLKIVPILLAMVGLAIWIPNSGTWWIPYAGLGIVAVAWVWVRQIKTNNRIILDTLNGEQTAMESTDQLHTERVVKAVRDAIDARRHPGSTAMEVDPSESKDK